MVGQRRQRGQPLAVQRRRRDRQQPDGRGRARRPRGQGVVRELRRARAGGGASPTLMFGGRAHCRATHRPTIAADAPLRRAASGSRSLVIASWIVGVVALQAERRAGARLPPRRSSSCCGARRRSGRDQARCRGASSSWSCGVTRADRRAREDRRHGPVHGAARALATPATLNGVIAFVTGLISTYSSTSGVVLPAFLPTVPGLVAQRGRRRSAGGRAQHQRRLVARRRLAAVDARRAVRRRRGRPGRGARRCSGSC